MEYLILRFGCSFLSGLVLSQVGSLLQLGTKNLLSSPSTLGFDGLAVFWIILSHSLLLWIGQDLSPVWTLLAGIPLFAFLGLLFAKNLKQAGHFERIILLGLTFNVVIGAIFSFWQFVFIAFNLPFPLEIWFGHFRSVSWIQFLSIAIMAFVLLISLIKNWKHLIIYSLGPDIAKNLKLNSNKLFAFVFISVALGSFVVISSFGVFAFLGLIFPIVARKLWFKKFDLKGEFFVGAIINGLLFASIDLVCYQFPIYGAEVPVGLVATAIGAVSLILVLWKTRDADLLAKPSK
jgi:iron complex transport system permease protein